MTAAAGLAIAAWHLSEAPPLPVPLHPYRDLTRCALGPVQFAALDADGDDHPDIAILCEEELLVASGLNGDTLWRQDLPRPLYGSVAVGEALLTDGQKAVTVAYPQALLTFDVTTGRLLWSRHMIYGVHRAELEGDCLMIEGYRFSRHFSAESGEESSCPAPTGRRAPQVVARSSPSHREDEDASVRLLRDEKMLWSVPCGLSCSAEMTPGGVVVKRTGREAGCAQILNISRGQVVRVLEPQGTDWSFGSVPPYLVAWRRSESDTSDADRPVLEVFDATSFQTRWRSDPHEPPVVWRRSDHCDSPAPSISELPKRLSGSTADKEACATGITPRAATGRNDVVIRIRRTGCFGTCPSYVVTIFADGRIHYEGRSVDGTPDGQLTRDELAELTRAFREGGFFDLCDATRVTRTDSSSLYMDFWDGTRLKRVEAYGGNWQGIPKLRDLGEMVDEAIAMKQILQRRARQELREDGAR